MSRIECQQDLFYRHRIQGAESALPPGKVVCVGRNYAAHARELNNPVPDAPILFIKPASAIVPLESAWAIPEGQGECHHEAEIALLIGEQLHHASSDRARNAVVGYGVGLDLTLRDLQNQLKAKGHPWEIAKAFDGACPLSTFIPAARITKPEALSIELFVNEQLRQTGTAADMLTPLFDLVAYMSRHFTLCPGDVVLTGTPAGVQALQPGDRLLLVLGGEYRFEAQVLTDRPPR
jgi:2-keto-4-pentenoate hydratase/2-oxohepta-3-ene-1,7-dioic acid hydratase in catechol pathway